MTPIRGRPQVSADAARRVAVAHNAEGWFADRLPDIYWALAPTYGIRPEVAFAQACHETGFGHYGRAVTPAHHNYCGLKVRNPGADDAADSHARFRDPETGVHAHLQHLYAYAVGEWGGPPGLVDPRHFPSIFGVAQTVEELSGEHPAPPDGIPDWAPSATYHVRIVALIEEMLDAMTSFYLLGNPPRTRQFRASRRAAVSGTIVLHTAESIADVHPPDDDAEGVARFIRDRRESASYHALVDSDSIVRLVPWSYEAFHDGTGSNPWSIGLSVACNAAEWPNLPEWWVEGAVRNLATIAREAIDWCRAEFGIVVPRRRLNRDEVAARAPGFTTHADRETWFGTPGRRSDPGQHFPWDLFFGYLSTEDDDMMTHLAWLREKPGSEAVHCYRITGGIATYFETHDQIGAALWLGAKWFGGTEAKSFLEPKVWRPLAVLNGPLRNVPTSKK